MPAMPPRTMERVPSPAPSSSSQSVASSYRDLQVRATASEVPTRSIFSSASEMSKSVKARMPTAPWKRRPKKKASTMIVESPPTRSSPIPRSSGSSSQPLSPSVLPRASLPLGQIFRNLLHWRRRADHELERIQAGIDDMWLHEMMLGCDTELFETVRKAAEDVERGGEPSASVRRGEAAAAESEAMALQSLRARLQARDVVHIAGGAEALERRVREIRARAIEAVKPWIQLLGDRRQCPEVRKAMEVLLRETREEYESTLEMKTAKAEVVQELQDRGSQQEWMIRQLVDVVEILEDSLLCTPTVAADLELFFPDVLAQPVSEELRTRTVSCLRVLARCGAAARRALNTLGVASGGESEADDAEVTLEVTDTEASVGLGSFPLRLERPGTEEAAQNSPQSVTAAGTPTSPLEEDEECEEMEGQPVEAATASAQPEDRRGGGYDGDPATASQAAAGMLAAEPRGSGEGPGGYERLSAVADPLPSASPLDKVLDQLHVSNPQRMAPASIYD